MTVETYNLPSVVKGSYFSGVEFTVLENNVALNLTGASISLVAKIWNQENATAVISLSVGSGITITDAAGGMFDIDEQLIDVEARCYYYDIKITLASGVIKTYIRGTFEVIQNYS